MGRVRDVYVGIDVHSVKHSAAVLPLRTLESPQSRWKRAKVFTVTNCKEDFSLLERKIKRYASSPDRAAIAVDQTGHYSAAITFFFRSRHYPVFFVESIGVKGVRYHLLGEESKSDEDDARSFAYLLYLKDKEDLPLRLSEVVDEVDSAPTVLRTLFLQRAQYVKLVIQTSNRLHYLFNIVFPEAERILFPSLVRIAELYPTPKDIVEAEKRGEWASVKLRTRKRLLELARKSIGVTGEHYGELIKYFGRLLADANDKCQALEQIIKNEVLKHPYGKVLSSFPNMGLTDAALLISVVGQIERWGSDKKLRKALGVYPVFSKSGKSFSRSRQGKEGNKMARAILFRVVVNCLGPYAPDNDFRDYFVRLRSRGKPGRTAVMGAAGKLAEAVYHCLLKQEPYEYQGIYKPRRMPKRFLEKYYAFSREKRGLA